MSEALASPTELCQDAANVLTKIKTQLGDSFVKLVGEDVAREADIFLEEASRYNDVLELWADVANEAIREWAKENEP